MTVLSMQDSEDVASRKEAELRAQGYVLTNKTDGKDLLPGEYVKGHFTGTPSSLEGPGGVTLKWRPFR